MIVFVGALLGCWWVFLFARWAYALYARDDDQYVKLTPKRTAELIDLDSHR